MGFVCRDYYQVNQGKTAILLFSRSLDAEFRAKSFGLTKDRFRLLYTALLKKTRKILDDVNAPVFEFNSHQQVGNAFGERLVNAIENIQLAGFNHVIVIGNDAPGLNPEILNKAIQQVENGKSVLGRDDRGGCYLMGFDINEIELNDFTHIQWHSHQVFDQVNSLLQADTSLPQLADLNSQEDIKSALLLNTSPRLYLIDLLLLVFNGFFRPIIPKQTIQEILLTVPDYRGPPSLVSIPSY